MSWPAEREETGTGANSRTGPPGPITFGFGAATRFNCSANNGKKSAYTITQCLLSSRGPSGKRRETFGWNFGERALCSVAKRLAIVLPATCRCRWPKRGRSRDGPERARRTDPHCSRYAHEAGPSDFASLFLEKKKKKKHVKSARPVKNLRVGTTDFANNIY